MNRSHAAPEEVIDPISTKSYHFQLSQKFSQGNGILKLEFFRSEIHLKPYHNQFFDSPVLRLIQGFFTTKKLWGPIQKSPEIWSKVNVFSVYN